MQQAAPKQPLLRRAKRTLIGDRAFYAMVLAIVLPIIVQNAISNFVNLLDNIMVGRIGTDQMTGVSIVNQLLFVFNLCIFGGVSGAGIFAAQYHGAGNHEGVRDCLRFKLMLAIGITALGAFVFALFDTPLISLYLNEEGAAERVAQTLKHGEDYLKIMLFGLPPFAISQAYASTLRETGETALPMRAGIAAVLVNLLFNYILIYGKLGAPALGVRGAAIATVLSRYVELAIIVLRTHTRPDKYPFARGVYHSMRVPLPLVKQIAIKGTPLLVNEAFWSLGISVIARCYSLRGLDVVTALNISNTVANLFNVVFLSMGNATAIIIGQALGAQDIPRAKDYVWKLVAFGIGCCMVTGVLLAIASPFIPMIYNTEDHVRSLATRFLLVCAAYMPVGSFCNSSYFILRSGGKTMLTFLFDCVFTWTISLALAYSLVTFTSMDVVAVYLCVQMADLIKCVLGFILVKKGIWIHNMVSD